MSNRQSVLDNVKTVLSAISTGGGYNYTPGLVAQGLRHFQEVAVDKFPALFVAGADEKRNNETNSRFRSVMEVAIVGYIRSASDDREQPVTDLSKLVEDVTKALYLDHTRGGYSTFTEVSVVETDQGDFHPYAGFRMTVLCDYRAAFSTP